MVRRVRDFAPHALFLCLIGCVKKEPEECHEARQALSAPLQVGNDVGHGALLEKRDDAWRRVAEAHAATARRLAEIKSSKPAIGNAVAKLSTAHNRMADVARRGDGQK